MDTMRDPCRGHKCAKGQCEPDKAGEGYKCLCRAGYTGKFCDQKRDKSKLTVFIKNNKIKVQSLTHEKIIFTMGDMD